MATGLTPLCHYLPWQPWPNFPNGQNALLPPWHPWPWWPGSWGPVYSRPVAAAGGAGGPRK